MMGNHSTLVGGSTAARVINCPPSVRMSRDLPPAPESEHARRGSALHYIMEKHMLDEDISYDAGMTIMGHTLTLDDLIAIDAAKDAVNELFKQHDIDEYEPEGKVSYGSIPGAFGTCDIVARTKDGALVIADFKFGDGVLVSPVENSQFLFYAGAVIDGPEFRDWTVTNATPVHLAVIQPAQDTTLNVWSCTVRDVIAYTAQLKIAVDLVDDPTLEPQSGDHCRWCPAFSICPRHMRNAERALQFKREGLNDLSAAIAMAEELEPWIRSVRKTAHEQLELGARVPGYKLVRAKARRAWLDEDGLISRLKRMRKLSRAEYLDEKVKSVAQLEKLCKAKRVDFEQFKDYYDLVSKGTSVVPESDSRPGIVKSADRELPEQLDTMLNGNGNGDK